MGVNRSAVMVIRTQETYFEVAPTAEESSDETVTAFIIKTNKKSKA